MTNLQCSVSNCSNWCNNCCSLNEIEVSSNCSCRDCQDTCCASFQERGSYLDARMGCETPSVETDIRCGVSSCAYHDHGCCTADNVSVNGDCAESTEETCCGTWKKRR